MILDKISTYTLKLAEEKDIIPMLDIYKPFVTNTSISLEYIVPTRVEFMERFKKGIEAFPWIVCATGNVVAGYAYASRTFSRIGYQWDASLTVYVSPEYQKRNIGCSLYQVLFEILDLQGFYNLYGVITGNNHNSIRMHEKMGFVQESVFHRVGYKFGEWHDVIWMVKRIEHTSVQPVNPLHLSQINPDSIDKILRKNSGLVKSS